MLEYMMLRPKDDAVFEGAWLQYLVLDKLIFTVEQQAWKHRCLSEGY